MRVFLALLLLSLHPLTILAQFDAGSFINTDIAIEAQPTYPQPGEVTTFTLNDYGGNYYGATLEWYKDGVLIDGTNNQRNITVVAPPVGEKTTISLTLKLSTGGSTTLKKVLAPVYVDVIVEPQTHVPGFYKGRALPSAGSTVNLTALLNNGAMMGNRFVYTWRINEEVLEGGPLFGRNKISFVTPLDRELNVSVQVTTQAGDVIASRSTYISSATPALYFYELNTLYGVETRAIKNDFTMIGNAATIKAEPYYLDSNVFNRPEIFEWRINSQKVSNGNNDPYTLTLEKTGQPGRAEVNLHVRSTVELLQGARGGFNISL